MAVGHACSATSVTSRWTSTASSASTSMPWGGADNIVVNDLTGTGVTQVNINLASTIGGSTGDGQVDSVVVNGTGGDDVVKVSANGGVISVSGLSSAVTIAGSEATDQLTVNGGIGADTIN